MSVEIQAQAYDIVARIVILYRNSKYKTGLAQLYQRLFQNFYSKDKCVCSSLESVNLRLICD